LGTLRFARRAPVIVTFCEIAASYSVVVIRAGEGFAKVEEIDSA
jgi:hypothetical protein